jgi:hypothetical protein
LSEEHPSLWERRIQSQGLPRENLFFVFPGPGDGLLEEVRQFRPDVLVLDTLRVFVRISDENDAAGVQAALNPWVALARELNLALILLHHRNKTSGPEEGLDHAGSHAFVGAVDVAISMRLEGNSDSPRRVLEVLSRFAETPRQLVVALTEHGYEVLGTPAELERARVKERIVEVLADCPGGWVPQAQLKQALKDVSSRTLERALAELVQDGQVEYQRPARNRPASYRLKTAPEPLDPTDLIGFPEQNARQGEVYSGERSVEPELVEEPVQQNARQGRVNSGERSVQPRQGDENQVEPAHLDALEEEVLHLLTLPQAEAEARAEELLKRIGPVQDEIDPALLAILQGHRPPEPDEDAEREIARLAWQMSIYRPIPEHYWPIIEERGFSRMKLPPRKQFHKLMKQVEELAKSNVQVRALARSLLNWLLRPKVDGYLENAVRKPLSTRICEDCGCEFVTDSGSRMCYLCRVERRKGR